MRNSIRIVLAALATAMSMAACTQDSAVTIAPGQPGGEAPSRTGPAPEGGSRVALMEHMHQHYSRLAEIRDAVIIGDIARVEVAAYWLAQHAPPLGMPDAWAPYLTRMRDGAARLELLVDQSNDPDAILAAVDDLEQACRDCHEANAVDLEMPPAQSPATIGALQEHRSATEPGD